jgi:hypothetical protein
MKTISMTFQTEAERDEFVAFIAKSKHKNTISTIKYDPTILYDSDMAAIFINNTKMYEGNLNEMNSKFFDELNAHKAPMTLKKMVEGKWVVIRSRLS